MQDTSYNARRRPDTAIERLPGLSPSKSGLISTEVAKPAARVPTGGSASLSLSLSLMGSGMSGLGVAALICGVVFALALGARFCLQRSLDQDKAKCERQKVVPSNGASDGGGRENIFDQRTSEEALFSSFSTGVTSEKDFELANSLAEARRVETNMAHVEQASAHLGGVLERLGSSRQISVMGDNHLDSERRVSMT